jgi:DNA/RNA-binding domain of Phe-tRNA-synthetase-like protein
MWFILESLGPMPLEALHDAGAALCDGLRTMMPGSRIETRLLTG